MPSQRRQGEHPRQERGATEKKRKLSEQEYLDIAGISGLLLAAVGCFMQDILVIAFGAVIFIAACKVSEKRNF